MYRGYKIVCVTPAGRERYLRILAKYILECPLVDEYHLWKNTLDRADLDYIAALGGSSTKVRVIDPPINVPGDNLFLSISQFFLGCIASDTIYIRFDDDIVFLEARFFERFLDFRINHPEYFLVFPNIINNAICSYILAETGVIAPDGGFYPWCMDLTAWHHPRFAEQLHRSFLASAFAGDIDRWHFGPKRLALTWFSINCMSWFGSDFESFGGRVEGNEEEFLTVRMPMLLDRINCIYGDVISAHFAFYPQREHLDSTDLLDQYRRLQDGPGKAIQGGRGNVVADRSIWTPRLMSTIQAIAKASVDELTDIDFIANQIRYTGLTHDTRRLYGNDNVFMNAGIPGMWQHPMQLARCLEYLAQFKISRVLELGTGSGWTTTFIAAYLLRFNEHLSVDTVDFQDLCSSKLTIEKLLPIRFHLGKTSEHFANESFDLVFLDCDHSYSGCIRDYSNVGRKARICMFHDIKDTFVRQHIQNSGGVPRAWEQLRMDEGESKRFVEFLDHSDNVDIMGIGLIIDRSAPQGPPID